LQGHASALAVDSPFSSLLASSTHTITISPSTALAGNKVSHLLALDYAGPGSTWNGLVQLPGPT
jgi:hypothetical protein